MSKIRIKGLNAGRGSFSAVSKGIYTKFHDGTIKKIVVKTFGKMFAIEGYNSIAGFVVSSFYNLIGAREIVLDFII